MDNGHITGDEIELWRWELWPIGGIVGFNGNGPGVFTGKRFRDTVSRRKRDHA